MDEQGRLKELWNDLYNEELKTKVSLLQQILKLATVLFNLKKKSTKLVHPVEEYKDKISQPYGTKNKEWYPQTGRHIGTDYACPYGTAVRAPFDGEVITSGYSQSLGNFCIYEYTFENIKYQARFLHLNDKPVLGRYKTGSKIAETGSTGRVSGAHLHCDVFYNEVRLDKLTAKNWNLLTVNPQEHF
jgi:murein DD-endopeptidase MepM/ murein hydrolase activator NlpD